jgi:uncharacterized phage-like protein YoqJ
MLVAVTGHRPNKLGNDYQYTSQFTYNLRDKFIELLKEFGATEAISGMALGVDQIFAYSALIARVPLIAAIPFDGQEKVWPPKSQQRYRELLASAAHREYISTSKHYTKDVMQKRNVWMVDQLVDTPGKLIAVWNGSTGGTYNCVNYASSRLKTEQIVIIKPDSLIEHPLDYISMKTRLDV